MLKRKLLRLARLTEDRIRQVLRLNESTDKRERDAQEFWSKPIDHDNSFWWHARDSTVFADADDKWKAMGRRHLALFDDFARIANVGRPVPKIVDWGCGGGANAGAFARECQEMWGVDVSADALKECAKQLAANEPACTFHPVQLDVTRPEAALEKLPHDIDLFHSYYVFELFPSEEYGARILRIAEQLLKPGGLCIIHIKYATGHWSTRPRKWGYKRGVANMTSYRVEAFWELAEKCGLPPRNVVLVPQPLEVPDGRYAYFMLQKPGGDMPRLV